MAVKKQVKNEVVKDEAPKNETPASYSPQAAVLSKAEQMKANLDAQPKVRIHIPLERGEKKGAVMHFCINGYRLSYPKGAMVDVPEQVAQMIAERLDIELSTRSQSLDYQDKERKDALNN
jgi:hypothetical protein